MTIVSYAYYSEPWKRKTGDDTRIHSILEEIRKQANDSVVVYILSHKKRKEEVKVKGNLIYVVVPRYLYYLISKAIYYNNDNDLNPLVKLTNLLDEVSIAAKLNTLSKHHVKFIYVFGSMTVLPYLLRLFGSKIKIVYDPLANYSQTLFMRSRNSFIELLRYALYLSLHKKQLNASDCVVYPSEIDKDNAVRSFKIRKSKTFIVPNPYPLCYESYSEYVKYRMKKNENKPYFILLAGGRGKSNEEATKYTIKVFNEIEPNKFKLFITGPWTDLQHLAHNDSIKLVGYVSLNELKHLLALSDFGLSPVFSHSAGTFIKILAYMAAGLNIISTPYGLYGLPIDKYKGKVVISRSPDIFRKVISDIVDTWPQRQINTKQREIVTCDKATQYVRTGIKILLNKCTEERVDNL